MQKRGYQPPDDGQLIAMLLKTTGFKRYCCDRPMPLRVNLTSLTKVLK
jgi:proliferating cell nuclear antigen